MSEDLPNAEEKVPWSQRPVGKCGCLVFTLVVFVLLLGVLTGTSFHVEILYHLAVGWGLFLFGNIHSMEVNLEMALCGIGALLIATYGLHRILVWLRNERPWKWAWTLSITALTLMLFAASIAMTGMIHQLGWMMREPLTQNNRDHSFARNMSKSKQIFMLLVEYEYEKSELPPNLQTLVEIDYISAEGMREFRFYPGRGHPREPWIYLGAGKSLSGMEEGGRAGVLLLSPHPIRGRWIVLAGDGAVERLETQDLHKKYPELLERLPHLMIYE